MQTGIMATTMKALRQLEYAQPLEVCDHPIPTLQEGQAIVRILAASIISYTRDIYNGTRKYPYPTPLTTGNSAVGRVHSLPPDSTSLQPGQLVVIDITYRSRDDPTHIFLSAIADGSTPGSKKLMSHWRNGTFAEYASIPLENCYPLNESMLLGSPNDNSLNHGYAIPDLLSLFHCLVPFGGLTTINLRPSETIIIAPATGPFGIAAVQVSLALGARVIAMGRNTTTLAKIKSTFSKHYPPSHLLTVPLTNDHEKDLAALKATSAPFPIDAYLDISPPAAANSTHMKSCIMALKHSGRVSLMGGLLDDVAFPHRHVMRFNIEMKGKWMFERQDVRDMIRMVEVGNLKLVSGEDGSKLKGFTLEEWKEAFEWGFEHTGLGEGAYFGFEE